MKSTLSLCLFLFALTHTLSAQAHIHLNEFMLRNVFTTLQLEEGHLKVTYDATRTIKVKGEQVELRGRVIDVELVFYEELEYKYIGSLKEAIKFFLKNSGSYVVNKKKNGNTIIFQCSKGDPNSNFLIINYPKNLGNTLKYSYIEQAQKETENKFIEIKNKSFEGSVGSTGYFDYKPLTGWIDLGTIYFPGQSPYDILNGKIDKWKISQTPSDGNTYLGLISRIDGSFEALGQYVNKSFQKEHTYEFNIDVCYDKKMTAGVRKLNGTIAHFHKPMILEVILWKDVDIISNKHAFEKSQVVYKSEPIDHEDWRQLNISFIPNENYNFIELRVAQVPENILYNGHILLDNMSDIIKKD